MTTIKHAFRTPMINFTTFVSNSDPSDVGYDQDILMYWDWDFMNDFYERKNLNVHDLEEWEKYCFVEIQVLNTENDGKKYRYCIHEMLENGSIYIHDMKPLDGTHTEEHLKAMMVKELLILLKPEWITKPRWKYAALAIFGDVDPILYPDFTTEQDRDNFMLKYRKENGPEDGLYFIQYTGELEIDAPSGLFFEEEE